ncbi:CGNR zinc finger domain-containing protein [Spirillospora sp. CA-294931]|uniref:CGNR zinc finger domain-containing protein n=1 Tax=Spirillospora sp. CA-294931 TaxID=3240042 RepID=UPI003D8C1C46
MHFDGYSSPGGRLAQDLVNTQDVVKGSDGIPDVPSLESFLRKRALSQDAPLTGADLALAIDLRTRLRRVFVGGERNSSLEALNTMLRECGATPQLITHDGSPLHLHVTTPDMPAVRRLGADAAMGMLSVIRANGFERFRVCGGRRCQAVFLDVSKNGSRRFCSPSACGNRSRAATFRAKDRGARPPGDH